jgi:uncharacterized protein YecE (DUF72 family)
VSRLLIGLPRLTGKLGNYAKRYGMLELPAEAVGAKARQWRKQGPPAFAFSLVLPAAVGELRDDGTELARALDTAHALEASCLVLRTPPAVRPTKENRERIIGLGGKLPRAGQLVAWEPAGLWSADDVAAVALAGGWLAIADAAEEELAPGPFAYTRIQAFGKAARLGTGRIERIAAQLAGRREAYVVADPVVAPKLVAALPAAVERVGAGASVPQLFRPTPSLALSVDEEQ